MDSQGGGYVCFCPVQAVHQSEDADQEEQPADFGTNLTSIGLVSDYPMNSDRFVRLVSAECWKCLISVRSLSNYNLTANG